MKLHLAALCASALVLPGAASAQSTNSPSNPANTSSSSMPAKGAASGQQASADNLLTTKKLMQDLQNAGFTNVKVVAQAYVVQAKTKDGNPVVMTLGPHGFSAFEAIDATGSTGKAAQGDQHALAVSRLKDMNLYNANGDMLGDVEHVVSDGQGRNSIVIGKGGFLGLGEKQVAIPLSNVVMRGDRLVTRDLSDEQIKAMPEWKKGQQQTELDPGRTVQVRSAS
ncbi:PRC-barrel domain-containing protein [Methylobacterium sp. CM6257]